MIVPYPEAQVLERYYVCSDCWEPLRMFSAPKDAPHQSRDVHCMTPGCECHGFVSEGWVAIDESEQEYRLEQAKEALKNMVDWIEPEKPRERRSVESALKELGF